MVNLLRDTLKISDGGRVKKGSAFEYACALEASVQLKCPLIICKKVLRTKYELERMRGHRDFLKIRLHAKIAMRELVGKIPNLVGPVSMVCDSMGRQGEVCDIDIGRVGGMAVGVSCKWNNKELKHPRLLKTTDVIGQLFKDEVASSGCTVQIRKNFDLINNEISRNPGKNWADFRGRGEVLSGIAAAVTKNAKSIMSEGWVDSSVILDFVFGKRDHCVILGGRRSPFLAFYNPNNSLAPGEINKTRIPRKIKLVSQQGGSGRGVLFEFSQSNKEGPPLVMLFRIHQASKKLAPSLKWGVRWAGSLFGFMEYQEISSPQGNVGLLKNSPPKPHPIS